MAIFCTFGCQWPEMYPQNAIFVFFFSRWQAVSVCLVWLSVSLTPAQLFAVSHTRADFCCQCQRHLLGSMQLKVCTNELNWKTYHQPQVKGTVLRDRFQKVWRKLTDLGLNKGRGWFLNFSEAPLIFGWNPVSAKMTPIAYVVRLFLHLYSWQAFLTEVVLFYKQPIRGRVGFL